MELAHLDRRAQRSSFEPLRARLAKGARVWLLLGSGRALAPYRRALDRAGLGAGVRVATPATFLQELARRQTNPPTISPFARRQLLLVLARAEGVAVLPTVAGRWVAARLLGAVEGEEQPAPAPIPALFARYLAVLKRLGLADPSARQLALLEAPPLAREEEVWALPTALEGPLGGALARAFGKTLGRLALGAAKETGLQVVAHPDRRAERDWLVAALADGLGAGSVSASLGLVARRPADLAFDLERALQERGYGLAFSFSLPFSQTPAGAALLGLARAAYGPQGEVEDVVNYLRLAAPRGEADALERHALMRAQTAAAELFEALPAPSRADLQALRTAPCPYAALAARARELGRLLVGRLLGGPPLAGSDVQLRALGLAAQELEGLSGLARRLAKEGEERLADALVAPEAVAVALRELPCPVRRSSWLERPTFPLYGPTDPLDLHHDRLYLLALEGGLARLPQEGLPPAAAQRCRRAEEERLLGGLRGGAGALWLSFSQCDERGRPLLPGPLVLRLTATKGRPATAPARPAPSAQAVGGALQPLLDAPLLPPDGVVDVTALEAYLRCPNRFLIERALGAVALAPPGSERSEGTLLHALLAQAFRRLQEEGTPTSRPRLESRLRFFFQEALAAEQAKAGDGAQALLVCRAGAALDRYLPQAAAQLLAGAPLAVELSFGQPGGALEALKLGNGVAVRGRIDRIDRQPDGRALVIDYKRTTKPGYAAARWRDHHTVQLGIYLQAVRELLDLPLAGGLYQPLVGKEVKPRGLLLAPPPFDHVRTDVQGAQFEELLGETVALAQEGAAQLKEGRLEPRQETCRGQAGGCAYPELCRWLCGL